MTLSKKKSALVGALLFTVVHYACTLKVFFVLASYASDIDGINPTLGIVTERLLLGAYYVLLFPFGYLPLGILFNSAVLGYALYYLLSRKLQTKVATIH